MAINWHFSHDMSWNCMTSGLDLSIVPIVRQSGLSSSVSGSWCLSKWFKLGSHLGRWVWNTLNLTTETSTSWIVPCVSFSYSPLLPWHWLLITTVVTNTVSMATPMTTPMLPMAPNTVTGITTRGTTTLMPGRLTTIMGPVMAARDTIKVIKVCYYIQWSCFERPYIYTVVLKSLHPPWHFVIECHSKQAVKNWVLFKQNASKCSRYDAKSRFRTQTKSVVKDFLLK